jgi:wyosine [tRNA(Phe)-imidazoG37] synthetase (radical SAM superfamily)
MMKYVYGPVRSRRLGLSLGVSLVPHKVCDFDCIYCQQGKGSACFSERREYVKAEDVLGEVRSWLQAHPAEAKELDYITLSGSGEPTLNEKIGEVVASLKDFSPVKIAVITNASLLSLGEVRRALLKADLIVPSLDAVSDEVFQKINRPASGIDLEAVIEGLIALRKEYPGKIWLEVMVVRGVNDDLEHIRKLKEIAERIRPERIQINSPVRATAEGGVYPAEKRKLNKIREILGERCEII